jgi:hypothetical protein
MGDNNTETKTKYPINDIVKIFDSIEDASNQYIEDISALVEDVNDIKIIFEYKYQVFINILFLFIIFGVLYVLYRDYMYRIASKMTRCTDITEIINLNINDNDNSYIYNIYIVHVNNSNNIIKDYILRFEYNFLTEETRITTGDHKIISPLLFSPSDNIIKMNKAFYIFDLQEKKKKFVDYYDKDSREVFFFDKKKMATKKYKYYITANTDEKLNDEHSIRLANFIKKYAYDDNINIDPLYNILYAIESKKNMEY